MRQLEAFASARETEVASLCDSAYPDFVRSVKVRPLTPLPLPPSQELFRVKEELRILRSQVVALNEGMSRSGQALVQRLRELVSLRDTSQRLRAADEALTTASYVLALSAKVRDYATASPPKFYPAIKVSPFSRPPLTFQILEQLEASHVRSVFPFTFGRVLGERVPQMKELVVRRVLEDVNRWLGLARERVQVLGEAAMDQAAQEQRGLSVAHSAWERVPDLVLAPLYQCLYMHEALGLADTFTAYYRQQRRFQLERALVGTPSRQTPPQDTPQYFAILVGHLVLEHTVAQTAPRLVDAAWRSSQWELALERLRWALKSRAEAASDLLDLRRLKEAALLFARTLSAYGYDALPLRDAAALALRDRFFFLQHAETERELNQLLARHRDGGLAPLASSSPLPPELATPLSVAVCSSLVGHVLVAVRRFLLVAADFAGAELGEVERLAQRHVEQLVAHVAKSWTDELLAQQEPPLTQNQAAGALVDLAALEGLLPHVAPGRLGRKEGLVREAFAYAQRNLELALCALLEQHVGKTIRDASLPLTPSKAITDPRPHVISLVRFGVETLPAQCASLPPLLQRPLLERYFAALAEELLALATRKGDRYNRHFATCLRVEVGYVRDSLRQVVSPLILAGPLCPPALPEAEQLLSLLSSERPADFLDPSIRQQQWPILRNWRKMAIALDRLQADEGRLFFTSDHARQLQQLRNFVAQQMK